MEGLAAFGVNIQSIQGPKTLQISTRFTIMLSTIPIRYFVKHTTTTV